MAKKKNKYYCLVEFPYPSGDGLHVGHLRSYTAMDIIVRKKRMQGYDVLYPIGFDAFGLPAENYAIKMKTHPAKTTQENTKTFTRQLKDLNFSFDWERSFSTTDPDYYKWTQWIFIQMFKKGLAYKDKQMINWCTSCKIGLANEEVVGGVCERCEGEVVKKEKDQWMLKITEYADRLIEDLDQVDYLDKIKAQQINWIGRSEGLEEDWQVEGMNLKLKTFTTWSHTTWGATFMVIAPEHSIIKKLIQGTEYEEGAKEFCQKAIQDKIKDPLNVEKNKEGFFIGRYVINHLNKRRMPLYIANFAVYDYGTGIVKCTPTHDQRDFEFAKKYNLEFVPVIYPRDGKPFDSQKMKQAYTGEGLMMNAAQFDNLPTDKARKAIAEYTIKQGNGRWVTNYKLRDWIFSRQRYWGEPIPMIHCEKCGWQPVPDNELPVELPNVEKYEPTDTGESPLAKLDDWVNTKCPKCGGPAKRETDTMPNWAGSNWYYLRYIDPKNDKALADKKKLEQWMPVDWYNGGMEHTTLHLLYSRFVYKFLWDIGAVPKKCGPEPYAKRTSHGMILGEGGIKMSKSKDNVINPDEVIKEHGEYGADILRVYEMFMGPFDQAIPWDTKGIIGVKRFLEKIENINWEGQNNQELTSLLHKTIKKVTEDIDTMDFNTAVAQMMVFVNKIHELKSVSQEDFEKFLIILAPFAPALAEKLWKEIGGGKSIFEQNWPEYDEKLIKQEKITLVVQVNGKVRGDFEVEAGITENKAIEIAKELENVKKYLADKEIEKVIFVKDKLINIVV